MITGVFTTIKIKQGIPLFFKEHKKRLITNAKALSIKVPGNFDKQIDMFLNENNFQTCALRIEIKPKGKLLFSARPIPPSTEVSLITVADTRNKFKTFKTTDRIINDNAKKLAEKNNANDAIFTDNKILIESTIANIFSINKNGDIITPPLEGKGLKGITRKIIMENIKVLEQEIPEDTTQPIVLTSSLRIQKVTHLNGNKLKSADKLFKKIKTVLEKSESDYLLMRGVTKNRNNFKAGVTGVGGHRRAPAANARTSDGGDAWQDPIRNRTQNDKKIFYKRLQTWTDPEEIFVKLFSHEPSSFWLDSSLTNDTSRFSYMGIPKEIISYSQILENLRITNKKGKSIKNIQQDIFSYLKKQLSEQNIKNMKLPFDFIGGYVGYFGYELKKLTGSKTAFESPYPDSLWFYTEKTIVFDHQEKKVYLVCLSKNKQEADEWFNEISVILNKVKNLKDPSTSLRFAQDDNNITMKQLNNGKIKFRLDRDHKQYLKNIETCKKHLQSGNSYQICLTNRLTAKGKINPLELYLKLRKTNPAPYAAFIKHDELAILSSSPEEFLKIDDRFVETKPIKGTIRRGEYLKEDQLLIKQLSESKKDWSENAMIVDLLRNDLGKVSEFGSVKISKLMEIESYQTVHQLVSTVIGKLRKDKSIIDVVKAAFPGGSMTGTPKISTMEIINNLEKKARGIYSGSIGYLSVNQKAQLNIVIRTLVIHKDQLSIGAGGAILTDSDPKKEYEEMLLKANVLMQTTLNMYNPAMHTVYLALGSNVGNKKENMEKAIELLGKHVKNITVANFYETKPMYYEDQANFLNSALRGKTDLSPQELLTFIKNLEQKIGRKKRFQNGPREIDIDILFYDDIVFQDEHVQIPHPRIAERDFVLKPLIDLDPNFTHPVLKETIRELYTRITNQEARITEKKNP